jgi:hypothetical protein
VIEAEQVVSLYRTRKMKRQPMMDVRLQVLQQYNGDTKVDMPELDQTKKPAVANLLVLGLDGFAQRIASTLPDISYPSLRPGFTAWDEKARISRKANLGWWKMNRMQLLEYKRARYLLAYASAPVSIHPVSDNKDDKRKIPFWKVRSPLNTFPAIGTDELDSEPTDYIVCHKYPLAWLQDHYPNQTAVLYKGRESEIQRDMMFEVLEYNDHDETVMVACGQAKVQQTGWQMSEDTKSSGTADCVVLDRAPNRAGICNMVIPGRIVLDKPMGQFDSMLHLFAGQARMAAYEELSIFRSIFPDTWVQSHPNAPTRPKITKYADGKQGVVGMIENGVITNIQTQPGAQVPAAIDRLERAERLAANVPAEFGGESPTNVRTARRGASVLGSSVDMPLQEYQEILASSKDAENTRAVKIMKANYGSMVSMYVIPRDGKISQISGSPETYTPNDVFVTDSSEASYPFLGSDASSIPIEIGQRVGTKEMSLQTAREYDPTITDPVEEGERVINEGLLMALLGGLENQAAQGSLDPIVIAKIHTRLLATHKSLPEVYAEIHAEMQQEQAAAQQGQPALGAGPPALSAGPPGQGGPSPQQMPGAAVPPGGAAAGQPSIPPPPKGQMNLSQILQTLKPGATAGAPS